MADSVLSSAMYCIMDRMAENMEPRATPARTMVSGAPPVTFTKSSMITTLSIENRKADIVTAYGELMSAMVTSDWNDAGVDAARIARAAPKAAALDIPSVKGDASGFLRTDCITHPAMASVEPHIIAAISLGILSSQTTTSFQESPLRNMECRMSP